MMLFVGDDWAEAHHDVHLMDDTGAMLARHRLPEGLERMAAFHALLAEHATDPGQVVIGIETDRGLWVDALSTAGYQVYAINPLAVARYRDRHHLAGTKSDAGDAKVLADLVHRPAQPPSGQGLVDWLATGEIETLNVDLSRSSKGAVLARFALLVAPT